MKSTPIPFRTVPSLEVLKSAYPSVKAFFFDMDGTLFDTESIHADALLKMAAKYHIRPPFGPETVYELIVGKADHLVFDIIKYWEGVPAEWTARDFIDEKNEYVLHLLKAGELNDYFSKAVQNLLQEAKAQDLTLHLVTSSERVVTEKLLKITGLENFFDLVLTRDDCPRHKPDPCPYLMAIKEAGLSPQEILIFEDSHVGLEAASLTSAHVIKAQWYSSGP